MDYVDLYQIHRWDDRTPIEETMEALHDVVRAGKARYIGASACSPGSSPRPSTWPTPTAGPRFVSMQNHYNLIYREEEREMIPQCIDQGVGVIPWSPLARGRPGRQPHPGGRPALTTRSDTDDFTDYLYDQPTDFDVVERVAEVAAERGRARRPGGPGLAAAPAGRDRTDRRGHQARPPGRRPGRRGARPERPTRWPGWRSPTCPTRSSATSRRAGVALRPAGGVYGAEEGRDRGARAEDGRQP